MSNAESLWSMTLFLNFGAYGLTCFVIGLMLGKKLFETGLGSAFLQVAAVVFVAGYSLGRAMGGFVLKEEVLKESQLCENCKQLLSSCSLFGAAAS